MACKTWYYYSYGWENSSLKEQSNRLTHYIIE